MTKLKQAARQALEACEAGKKIAKLMAQLSAKLGHGDLAAEFLEDGIFERTDAALREALDHSADAGKMVQEPVKRFTSDDVKVAFENGYAAGVSVSGVAKEAEQEPVAWYLDTFDEDGELEDREYNGINEFSFGRSNGTPLYAAPIRTKDLTDDEIEECVHIADSECTEDACMPWFIEFARAVIAADREKNK